MKKIIFKSSILIIVIFLSVLLMMPAMIYAVGVPVTNITVTGAGGATTVVNSGTLAMSAAVLPVDAADKTVTWSVAPGTGTATIAADGVLTATGVGTVTVTATANDGSAVTGDLVITVTAIPVTLVPVTSITTTPEPELWE